MADKLQAWKANKIIERELGINSGPYTTASTGEGTVIDENAILDAIEKLKGHEQREQEYLINLLATMGFHVRVMVGFEEPTVFLPSRYQDAIQAVKSRNEAAMKQGGEMMADKPTNIMKKLRTAVADYMYSEGCSCCQDVENHKKHEAVLAKLLRVPKYKDGSGYDFGRYKTKERP